MNRLEIAGSGADPAPGARRLLAGWNESPELTRSVALRLLANWTVGHWEALDSPQGVVLRLPAITTGFFFFRDFSAFLSSLRKTRVSSSVDVALVKANSSCVSMMLGQGLLSAMAVGSLGSRTGCEDCDFSPSLHSSIKSLVLAPFKSCFKNQQQLSKSICSDSVFYSTLFCSA